MRFKLGLLVFLVGLVIILIGSFVPASTFAVVNVSTSPALSTSMDLVAITPSSQSSTLPTTYYSYSQLPSQIWKFTVEQVGNYTNALSLTTYSNSVSSYSQGQESFIASLHYTSSISSYYNTTLNSYVSVSVYYLYLNYTFGSAAPGNVFSFSGQMIYFEWNGVTYHATLPSTYYGEYETGAIQNVGHFYILNSEGKYQKLTPTSVVDFYTNTYPYTIQLYYVEDNGTTTNLSDVYIIVNSGTPITQASTNAKVNGFNAYEMTYNVAGATNLTINGYLQDSQYKSNIQLMSIADNFGSPSSVTSQSSSYNVNYLLDGVGFALMVAGIILDLMNKS